tara:strand:+ start:252 stop:479 length:228 start_codon:yes stop_codon:yes gene_type:complete
MPEVPGKVSLAELQLPWNFFSCCGFRNEEGKRNGINRCRTCLKIGVGLKALIRGFLKSVFETPGFGKHINKIRAL